TDPPTAPAASPSLPTAPESEKPLPAEATREPDTPAVMESVSLHRPVRSPLQQRPEYKRILQYLDPVPGAEVPPDVVNTLAQLSYCAFFGLRKNPFSQGSIPEFPY